MLGPAGGEQERLGQRRHPVDLAEDPPEARPERRPVGLGRRDDGHAARHEPRAAGVSTWVDLPAPSTPSTVIRRPRGPSGRAAAMVSSRYHTRAGASPAGGVCPQEREDETPELGDLALGELPGRARPPRAAGRRAASPRVRWPRRYGAASTTKAGGSSGGSATSFMSAQAAVHARATFDEVVPPATERHQARGEPDDPAHGLGEPVDRQGEVSQRIGPMPVDAELGDHDIRAEGAEHGRDDRLERLEVDRIVRVGVQRQVHRVPAPGALADLLDGARSPGRADPRARAWRW